MPAQGGEVARQVQVERVVHIITGREVRELALVLGGRRMSYQLAVHSSPRAVDETDEARDHCRYCKAILLMVTGLWQMRRAMAAGESVKVLGKRGRWVK